MTSLRSLHCPFEKILAGLEPGGIQPSKMGASSDLFDNRENDCPSNYLWSTCTANCTIIVSARLQEAVILTRRRWHAPWHYATMGMERIIRRLGLISTIVPLPQYLGMKEACSVRNKSPACLALWAPLQLSLSPQSMINYDLAEPLPC